MPVGSTKCAIVKSLKPVYTAPSEQAAKDRFAEFAAEWGDRYLAIVQLWRSSWAEFVPFLEYDVRDPPGGLRDQRDQCRSTPATAGPSGHADTSRTSRPRSSAFTS